MLALIHGGDVALCDEQVATVVDAARRVDPTVEVGHVDGETAVVHDLVSALTSLSLFAASRVVIVSDVAGRVAKEERLRDALRGALERLPPGLDVIFRERRDVAAAHPLAAMVRAAGGTVTASGRLQSRDFAPKLQEVAQNLDIQITGDALALLAERCLSEHEVNGQTRIGPDLLRGRVELEKLAAYAGVGRPIERADVATMVDEPDQRVFDFTDALGSGQLRRAGAVLEHLIDQGDVPQVIFANVVRQFRLLLLYVAGQHERRDTGFLRAGEFHLRDFQMRRLQQQAAAFSLERLRQVIGMLLRADEAIKTGKLDATQALWLLTESVCTGSDLLPG